MKRQSWIGTILLFCALGGIGAGLASWKRDELRASAQAGGGYEPMEAITTALADEQPFVRTTTAIGTVRALQSVRLQNELPGTVHELHLTPGEIVEQGTLLVALDVSVESAELAALEAQVALAETLLGRVQRALEKGGASAIDVDRAKAERDVARANVERTRAVIQRKTIRAPFKARVGMCDVHVGQYLEAGAELTTLQGIDDAVNIDFAVAQAVAARLAEGQPVEIASADGSKSRQATIVAGDARVDASTRNAWVRARLDGAGGVLAPGASVRVKVPLGAPAPVVVVPVSALRKGPTGDHVFVIAPDEAAAPGGGAGQDAHGPLRAHVRPVKPGPVLGDLVVIESGVAKGEQVAASGSFKLREGVLVGVAPSPESK